MNALIGINNFCDLHGPINIFSTQTVRDKAFKSLKQSKCDSNSDTSCFSCKSIENTVYFSYNKENDSSASGSIMYVSSEKAIFGGGLLKQAATRSLSCEVSSNNKEGLVYFGDHRGHILSCTFLVKDSTARGFVKLFSITIVMLDKIYLLNVQPFLTKSMNEIISQIQSSAEKVYEKEQMKSSQSAKSSNGAPRPLQELTGEPNIFAHLHAHFAWILWAGSRYYTESLTLGNSTVPALYKSETEEGFGLIQMDKEEFLKKKFENSESLDGREENLDQFFENDNMNYARKLKDITENYFEAVIYCVLVGVQMIVSGPQETCEAFIQCIKKILPNDLHRTITEKSMKYLPPSKARILTLADSVTIPSNVPNVCRIEFFNDRSININVRWTGELPVKLPTLMTKIIKAVNEKTFTDTILSKYLKSLIEEWKNKAVCLSLVHSFEDLMKIKKSMGIQQNDEALINHWMNFVAIP